MVLPVYGYMENKDMKNENNINNQNLIITQLIK
jgi:hypothetical protein